MGGVEVEDHNQGRRSVLQRIAAYRPGDMFFVGAVSALVVTKYSQVSEVILFLVALALGSLINADDDANKKRKIQ